MRYGEAAGMYPYPLASSDDDTYCGSAVIAHVVFSLRALRYLTGASSGAFRRPATSGKFIHTGSKVIRHTIFIYNGINTRLKV
jgi:hypothetical protein